MFTIRLLCLLSLFLSLFSGAALGGKPSVAFFYGDVPDELLYAYDWVVVDPSVFTPERVSERFYLKKRAKLVAYFSTGEVLKSRLQSLPAGCVIGENPVWHTAVIDLRKQSCFEYQLQKAESLLSFYDGLFLDTLNSYQLVLPKSEWAGYESAEVRLIKALRARYPKKILLLNGQFRIVGKVKGEVNAFVTESLFSGLGRNLSYVSVPRREQAVRLTLLKRIAEWMPVVVVDYMEKPRSAAARELARRIMGLGFIPWITNKSLTALGEGVYHLFNRKILLLYDPKLSSASNSDVHRIVQTPLEWLGYAPTPVPITGLDDYLKTHYLPKGVVVWNFRPELSEKLTEELLALRSKGVKVFIMDISSFTDSQLKRLGVKSFPNKKPFAPLKLVYHFEGYPFEVKAYPTPTDTFVVPEGNYRALLEFVNPLGQRFVPVAVTDWGGYGYSQYLVKDMFNDVLWVCNPFVLFREVFGSLPLVPDVTTESGSRILTVHLDGDGFADKSAVVPGEYTGEVLRDKIFKVFKVPHTVSVIVGELDPHGLYPDKAERLMAVARSIFALPNVEPASHTYSHPFNWWDIYLMSLGKKLPPPNPKELPYGYHLNIPGYTKVSISKEIDYSVHFIDRYLTPPGKKVKDFLWSGDCDPPAPVVKRVYDLKLYNVNGGDTTISDTFPYLCRVSPMGIDKAGYFQVYAPFQNENVYTNEWTVKDGYLRVISGFKLTDSPRRLKPISIYYHFYSGEDPSAFNALKAVYRWALSQEVVPLYLSQYAQRVLEFRGTAVASFNDGRPGLVVCSAGSLKTVRIDSGSAPSVSASRGVVGYRRINGSIYVTLSPEKCRVLRFGGGSPFRLVRSNGVVTSFDRKGDGYFLSLKSETDSLEAVFDVSPACSVKVLSKGAKVRKEGEVLKVESPEKEVRLEVHCKG